MFLFLNYVLPIYFSSQSRLFSQLFSIFFYFLVLWCQFILFVPARSGTNYPLLAIVFSNLIQMNEQSD